MRLFKATIATALTVSWFVSGSAVPTIAAETEPSLVSFSSGAFVIRKPAEYSEGWTGFWMLDENPENGWASPEGKTENHFMVIELAEQTLLKQVEFDTAHIDGAGRGLALPQTCTLKQGSRERERLSVPSFFYPLGDPGSAALIAPGFAIGESSPVKVKRS